MTMVTCELQWLLYLLADLSPYQTQAVPLFCDSKSALYIAKNSVFHDRTKHIEIDCDIVRDRFLAGIIKPLGISSLKQIADLFIKPLGTTRFKYLVANLGVISTQSSSLWGSIEASNLFKWKAYKTGKRKLLDISKAEEESI